MGGIFPGWSQMRIMKKIKLLNLNLAFVTIYGIYSQSDAYNEKEQKENFT